jgi:hypothetical protein
MGKRADNRVAPSLWRAPRRARPEPPPPTPEELRRDRVARLQRRRARWLDKWRLHRAEAAGGLDPLQARLAAWALARATRCTALIRASAEGSAGGAA